MDLEAWVTLFVVASATFFLALRERGARGMQTSGPVDEQAAAEPDLPQHERPEVKADVLAGARTGTLVPLELVNSPFRLQRNEQMVYACQGVYGTTGKEWQGGSAGASVRVMKGFSVRMGGTRGRSVETPQEFVDAGTVALTTKHLAFASFDQAGGKVFRVPWGKLVSTSATGDKVFAFRRDSASAKPEAFHVEDARFLAELAAVCASGADWRVADVCPPDEDGAAMAAVSSDRFAE